MINKKPRWEIVPESNTEDGRPTTWALEINHEKWGRFVWIDEVYGENDATMEYEVIVASYYGLPLSENKVLVKCKSLTSAKRWVTMNLCNR